MYYDRFKHRVLFEKETENQDVRYQKLPVFGENFIRIRKFIEPLPETVLEIASSDETLNATVNASPIENTAAVNYSDEKVLNSSVVADCDDTVTERITQVQAFTSRGQIVENKFFVVNI